MLACYPTELYKTAIYNKPFTEFTEEPVLFDKKGSDCCKPTLNTEEDEEEAIA